MSAETMLLLMQSFHVSQQLEASLLTRWFPLGTISTSIDSITFTVSDSRNTCADTDFAWMHYVNEMLFCTDDHGVPSIRKQT